MKSIYCKITKHEHWEKQPGTLPKIPKEQSSSNNHDDFFFLFHLFIHVYMYTIIFIYVCIYEILNWE